MTRDNSRRIQFRASPDLLNLLQSRALPGESLNETAARILASLAPSPDPATLTIDQLYARAASHLLTLFRIANNATLAQYQTTDHHGKE